MERLAGDDSKAVLEFLWRMNIESPFSEHESYYSRSSHSDHDTMFFEMHRGSMRNIFSVAGGQNSLLVNSVAYRNVATDLEKLFIIGYALSAVHDELNKTDGMATCFYGSGHPRWFHGPFPSGWVTFSDKWNNDIRVPTGQAINNSTELKADLLVVQAYEAYEQTYREFYSKAFRRGDDGYSVAIPEKVAEFRVELTKLHQVLKSILEQLVQRIKEHC